jgi:DNA replication protein DnaC
MKASGYSEAEIEAKLGPIKNAVVLTEAEKAAQAEKEQAYWEKSRNAAAMAHQLARPAMSDRIAAVKTEYEQLGFGWDAAKAVIYRIAAVDYSDDELCARFGYDPKKGLMITGGVGIGKTTAFEMCKKHDALRATVVSCLTLKKSASKAGYGEIEKYETVRNVVFDDLGREGQITSNFGNKIEAVADIIAARYDLMRSGKIGKTHFTTNLSLDAIAEAYSPHIVDRLREMCNVLEMDGGLKSFRG